MANAPIPDNVLAQLNSYLPSAPKASDYSQYDQVQGLEAPITPQTYDAKTLQPTSGLMPSHVAQGLSSGKLVLDKNTTPTVKMTNGKGEVEDVKADDVGNKLLGGTHFFESKSSQIRRDELSKPENQGITGEFNQGIHSLANQFAFGAPDIINAAHQTPEEKLRQETREGSNRIGQVVGGLLGFGGNLLATEGLGVFGHIGQLGDAAEHLITGVVPEAAEHIASSLGPETATKLVDAANIGKEGINSRIAELAPEVGNEQAAQTVGAELQQKLVSDARDASLSKRLLGSAVNQAVQGAALSSPQALAYAITGDPQKAAETLGWGLGTGIFLGGAGELVKSAGKATLDVTTKILGGESGNVATELRNKVDQRTLNTLGFTKDHLKKMSPGQIADTVNLIKEQGLLDNANSRRDLGDLADALHDKIGKNIGDARAQLDELVQTPTASGGNLQKHAIQVGELSQPIQELLDKPDIKRAWNGELRNALQTVKDEVDKAGADKGYVSFADAQDLMSDLRDKYTKSIKNAVADVKCMRVVSPLDNAKAAAYFGLKNQIDIAGDRVVKAAQDQGINVDPNLIGDLVKNRNDYATLQEIEKAILNKDAAQAGNRALGFTDFIHMSGDGGIASQPLQTGLAAAGATIGYLTGIPGAGVAGLLAGKALGKVAGYPADILVKHWLEDKGLLMANRVLKRAAGASEGPDVFSAIMTKDALNRLKQTTDTIATKLQQMSESAVPKVVGTQVDPFSHLLGGNGSTTGLSKAQQQAKLQTLLAQAAANPQTLIDTTSHVSGMIQQFHPQLAEALAQHTIQKINYLHQNIPTPPVPTPFKAKSTIGQQSDWQKFSDKAEVAINPLAAIDHMAKGDLNDNHMDALNTLYPNIKQEFVNTIMQAHLDDPTMTLPYSARQKLTQLTGIPLDQVNGAAIQQWYAQADQMRNEQQAQQQSQSTRSRGKPKFSKSKSNSGTMFGPSANKPA
jgi:hypothetical protein